MSKKNIAEILAVLAAATPALPSALAQEQKSIMDARESMKTWMDSVKTKDASGNWDGVTLSVKAEEVIRREEELGQKQADFQLKVKPFMMEWEWEQEAKMLEALGKPSNPFSFGNGDKEKPSSAKTLYDHLKDNDQFKKLIAEGIPSNPQFNARMKLEGVDAKSFGAIKATFDSATGYPMPLNRSGEVVPFAHRRPVVADFLPDVPWNEQYYVYMENTTWTNAAAAVAESGTKPESTLAYTQRTVKIEVLAHTIPLTKQILRFGPNLEQEVNSQMGDMLALIEESALLYGNGTSPNLTGITTRAGIQTYARVGGATPETNLDAIFRLMQQIRFVGFANPNVIFMNPDNFTAIALLKDTLGNYIYSNPAASNLSTLWGVPYIQTPVVTLGTSVTGDFAMWARLLRSGNVEIEIGYVNDDFAKNKVTMRAEEFVALQVRRPAAFGTATNLN